MNALYKRQKKIKVFPLGVEELKRLSKLDSGITLRTNCRCHLKLNYSALPVSSPQFQDAVTEELNKRVLRFNAEINDIVLRYCNVRVITPIEAGRSRKLDIHCIADMYVFKPRCGSVLTGIVNKTSKDHLGCIMYDVFNVSIMKPQDVSYNQWPGRLINVEDEVTFKVVKVDISEVIPYIVGELVRSDDEANDEKDSVISTDRTSVVTSEERFSDLDDVMETLKDVKSKKRKLSIKSPGEISKKRRKLM